MRLGRVEIELARDGVFYLDGGAMFGVVPKPLWERKAPADERNRIAVAANAFLVALEDGRRALLECGMGRAWSAKTQEIYAFEGPALAESLAALGVAPEAIGLVALSHLHFDHAGRATRPEGGAHAPAFPNAEYVATRIEWEDAHLENERTRGSYRAENFEPLERAGQLRLVEADIKKPLELAPGLSVIATGGHTRGHAAYLVESAGKSALFWGDLLPMAAHAPAAWMSGYDLYPAEGCDAKKRLIEKSMAAGWLALLTHEPGDAIGTFARAGRRVEFRAAGEE